MLGAEVLVSDDADGFKTAADASGVTHQVCKTHVRRNTEAWVEAMAPALAGDADGSLAAIGVTPAQAVADGQELLRLVGGAATDPGGERDAGAIHRRYLGAPQPRKGETMSLAYRLRLFSLDRWNSVAAADALPDLGGAGRGAAGRDQQCL